MSADKPHREACWMGGKMNACCNDPRRQQQKSHDMQINTSTKYREWQIKIYNANMDMVLCNKQISTWINCKEIHTLYIIAELQANTFISIYHTTNISKFLIMLVLVNLSIC